MASIATEFDALAEGLSARRMSHKEKQGLSAICKRRLSRPRRTKATDEGYSNPNKFGDGRVLATF